MFSCFISTRAFGECLAPTPLVPSNVTIETSFRAVPVIDDAALRINININNLIVDAKEIINLAYEKLPVLSSIFERDNPWKVEGNALIELDVDNDDTQIRVIHESSHERTYDEITRVFSEIGEERPSLKWVKEEAIRRIERFAESLNNEYAYHLVIYDMYSDSFAEYKFIHEPSFTANTGLASASVLEAIAEGLGKRPKLYGEILIVTPLEVAILNRRGVRELAKVLRTELSRHVEVAKESKRALENMREYDPLMDVRELPTSFIALNPYVSAALQLTAAGTQPPHSRAFVEGLGVLHVLPRPFFALDGSKSAVSAVAFAEEEVSTNWGRVTFTLPVVFDIRPLPL